MEYEKITLPKIVGVAVSKVQHNFYNAEKDSSHLGEDSILSIPYCYFYIPGVTSSLNDLNYFYSCPHLVYSYSHVKNGIQNTFNSKDFDLYEFDNSEPITKVKIETIYGNNTLLSFDIKTTTGQIVRVNKTVSTASVCRSILLKKTIKNEYETNFYFLNRKNKLELTSIDTASWKWYNKCLERQKAPIVTKQNLQVGRIYKSKKGIPALFIGYVSTVAYKPEFSHSVKEAWGKRQSPSSLDLKNEISAKESRIKMATMWLTIPSYYIKNAYRDKGILDTFINKSLATGNYGFVSVLKRHTFIEMIEEIPAYNITAQAFSSIKNCANEDLERIKSHMENKNNFFITVRDTKIICKISKYVNLIPFGMDSIIHPYYQTLNKNIKTEQ